MGGSEDRGSRELGEAAAEWSARRVLLIVSEDDRYVSPCLIQAIRHEFPWLDVLFVDSLERACGLTVRIVPLLLVDLALFAQYASMIEDLQRAHPQAAVAFLSKGAGSPGPDAVLSLAGVRGVLPMSLALDVWLAAMRVLILGGEYFTAAFLLAAAQARRAAPEPDETIVPTDNPLALRGLTARELQILELVSRGRQNKLIAAALRLSENTVKIHIHHIIAKLGVHNRTEAASLYLEMPRFARERTQNGPSAGGLSP